ncbi:MULTISPECIES: ribose-phosphate diphosphokinase [Bacillaceae]|uniref:Putative ribose-phosphate pyrophosphokinase n=2 Tax=Bacillus salipaludis TaxID=2547811 RepID=A0AA90QRS4_9BACI|nr:MULTISPECIES: ribose-phosphate diphosphokinase [Bacillaceae]MDQ6598450.1 ribose-phosphate diphosphokinase [Bacillus salipaludis]MED1467534.1 ribose-phosphate diphosphokinase [Bacillus salipaludis]WHY89217.1 ribose-phosphate diphosphokinase [Neobacillus cucumis]
MTYQLHKKFKMFSLNSNPKLANEVADLLGCELGKNSTTRFSDGEIQIHVQESVRGGYVYLVQSTSQPNNEHIMELLIMIDAMKRASAKRINVVMPYYSYARQDRKARSREPITAKLIANLLQKAGATRLLTIDFHSPQEQGFFDIPVDHLTGIPILAEYFMKKQLEDVVVVAPHNGVVVKARKLASPLNAPIALIDRRNPESNVSEVLNIIGNVEGKNAIIIDGLVDTASNITLSANALIEAGAKAVYACCTHPVLSGPAISRIEASPIKELVVTNTIDLPKEKQIDKITVLSVAPLLAEAIDRIHNEKAVSPLFE